MCATQDEIPFALTPLDRWLAPLTEFAWAAGPGPHAADRGRRHPLVAGGNAVGVLVVEGGRDDDLTLVCDFLAATVHHTDDAARARLAAVAHAEAAAPPGGTVLVTGSFHPVGDAMRSLALDPLGG